MKSFAILSVLTTAAVAQSSSSSSAAPAATSNPLIPSGISSTCLDFLTALNADSSLSSCVEPLISATASLGPSTNNSSVSSAAISTALNSVCSSNSACPDTLIRGKIASFYGACPAELTNNLNQDVLRIYDVLYALLPFKNAACSKDDSGRYCAMELPNAASNSTSTSGSSTPKVNVALSSANALINQAKNFLTSDVSVKRASLAGQSASVPNITTYRATNIVFLFYTASMNSAELCSSCAHNVINAYINFEDSTPYAPSFNDSLLMSGQTELYNGMESTCGSTFLGGGLAQAAGGLSGSILSGSAPRSAIADLSVMITLATSVLALAFSLVL